MTAPNNPPIDLSRVPNDQFAVYSSFSVHSGKGDQVETVLRRLIKVSNDEPGTIQYKIFRDNEDPNTFHIFEEYTGRDAFAKHVRSKEFQGFVASGALTGPLQPKILKALQPL